LTIFILEDGTVRTTTQLSFVPMKDVMKTKTYYSI